jgi:hypothetical protein
MIMEIKSAFLALFSVAASKRGARGAGKTPSMTPFVAKADAAMLLISLDSAIHEELHY